MKKQVEITCLEVEVEKGADGRKAFVAATATIRRCVEVFITAMDGDGTVESKSISWDRTEAKRR